MKRTSVVNTENDVNDLIDFEAIGKRMREIRKSLGLNIVEVSRLTGLSTGVISALELARRNIGLKSLMLFARAYNCGIDEMVFGSPVSTASAPYTASSISSALNEAATPALNETEIETEPASGSADEGMAEVDQVPMDPYIQTLETMMSDMDEAEKEFMIRLIGTAHSEFLIYRNKG